MTSTEHDGQADEHSGVVGEVEHLAEVAAEGESDATPLIAVSGISIAVGIVVAILLAVAFLAYYLSR